MKWFKTFFILPLCLLLLNAIEETATYKLQTYRKSGILDPYVLTGILVFMFSMGFVIVGDLIAPHIKSALEVGHKSSRKKGGWAGILLFYALMLGLVYFLYFVIYVHGPQYLIPKVWR